MFMCKVSDDCFDLNRWLLFVVRSFFQSIIQYYRNSGDIGHNGIFTKKCKSDDLDSCRDCIEQRKHPSVGGSRWCSEFCVISLD